MGTFSDGSIQDITPFVSWTSSDTTKIAVTSEGMATGTAVGGAQITASWMGLSSSTSANVTSATLMSLAVDAIQLSLPQGYAQQFNVLGSYGMARNWFYGSSGVDIVCTGGSFSEFRGTGYDA